MVEKTTEIDEDEVRAIRSQVLLEASEFFRPSEDIVARILEEFADRASRCLDIVPND